MRTIRLQSHGRLLFSNLLMNVKPGKASTGIGTFIAQCRGVQHPVYRPNPAHRASLSGPCCYCWIRIELDQVCKQSPECVPHVAPVPAAPGAAPHRVPALSASGWALHIVLAPAGLEPVIHVLCSPRPSVRGIMYGTVQLSQAPSIVQHLCHSV